MSHAQIRSSHLTLMCRSCRAVSMARSTLSRWLPMEACRSFLPTRPEPNTALATATPNVHEVRHADWWQISYFLVPDWVDLKWIDGVANLINWTPSKDDPNSGTGRRVRMKLELNVSHRSLFEASTVTAATRWTFGKRTRWTRPTLRTCAR